VVTGGSLTITDASRIDDCNFKDIKMTQGQQIKVQYPSAAYVVFRSTSNQGGFKIKYSFIDRNGEELLGEEKTDEMKSVEFSQFHKTPMFIPFVVGLGVLVLVIIALTVCICLMCRSISKYQGKKEYLEAEAEESDRGPGAGPNVVEAFEHFEPAAASNPDWNRAVDTPTFVDPVASVGEYGNKSGKNIMGTMISQESDGVTMRHPPRKEESLPGAAFDER